MTSELSNEDYWDEKLIEDYNDNYDRIFKKHVSESTF